MSENPATSPRPGLRDLLMCMRPNQWTKNGLVLAAFFFAFWDRHQEVGLREGFTLALPAAALFCIVSSGIYIMNDLRDLDADRLHPRKRYRPLASGRVPVSTGRLLSALLIATGLAAGFALSSPFGFTLATYVLLQVAYTFFLKRLALVDVCIIAVGFVLRAIAGAVVLQVSISPWLELCTFFLALFLALCKRRHEKLAVSPENESGSRETLLGYDQALLDLLIGIAAASTAVSYALYTLWPDTVEKFGTDNLSFTVPIVIFGLFRYLHIAFVEEKAERPEKVLLSDPPIILTLVLYIASIIAVFMTR